MTRGRQMTESHTNISPDEPISSQIVEAVADSKDTKQTELPPLYDTIDPDALDIIVQEDSITVSFQYAGYAVEVCGTTEILIQRSKE